MQFLNKFFLCLSRFFRPKKQFSTADIPTEVSEDEILVRGIVKSLFYSGKKLTDKSFLPPPNRNDVSVLRHSYTNSDFCKNHAAGLKIGSNVYTGLAVLLAKSVHEVNSGIFILSNGERLSISIKATPQPNLRMHADILYSHVLDDDEPKTLMRKIAKELIKKSHYLNDPNPNMPGWHGKEIDRKLFDTN